MNSSGIKIKKITIATTNTKEMANFYNTLFKCNLKSIDAYGTTLYTGEFAGLNLLLCPNKIAGVKAEQNRQQFDIEAKNIAQILADLPKTKGKIKDVYNKETKSASIIDPDGNTLVLIAT